MFVAGFLLFRHITKRLVGCNGGATVKEIIGYLLSNNADKCLCLKAMLGLAWCTHGLCKSSPNYQKLRDYYENEHFIKYYVTHSISKIGYFEILK